MQKLSEDQCRRTIAEGEIPEEVRRADERVAVVLTQSWCPDWLLMRSYLSGLEESGVSVFFVEYDRESFFHELMAFKENVFRSMEVPYVRYYRDGALVAESNLVFSRRGFLKRFKT